jgi:Xaa-Pro aminopeptidase
MRDRLFVLFLLIGLLAGTFISAEPASAAPSDPYAARRAALMAKIGTGIILIPSQIPNARGGGAQDNKDFIYLTGQAEPEALLVLWPAAEKREIYFNRTGKWPQKTGLPIDAQPLSEARMVLWRGLANIPVHVPFSALDAVLTSIGGATVISGAPQLVNLDSVLAEMRIVKSPEEIEILQRAIDLTAAAYVEALKAAKPGRTELDIQAVFQYMYSRREASSSFTQVASGPNSVNIHFGAGARELRSGDLIVFDLGAWVDGYTSDISRTVPAGGVYSPDQAALYNVVLAAEKEGIRLMVAGNGILKTQTAVEDVLLLGLQKLGLVTDPASPWQRRFYIQHGFTHGIGLDIHDVWGWFSRQMREGMAFKPGMVLTMEPGLYFPAGRLDKYPPELKSMVSEEEWKAFAAKVGPLYKKYENMGCRIEDDVLVAESGNRVLTAGAPKEIADIEKTMKKPSSFPAIK